MAGSNSRRAAHAHTHTYTTLTRARLSPLVQFIDDPLEAAGASGTLTDDASDGTFGHTDHVVRDKDGTPLTEHEARLHANWDSSVHKYTPHSLKGIKPVRCRLEPPSKRLLVGPAHLAPWNIRAQVTAEPWARDEAVYQSSRNSVDLRGISPRDMDAMESFSFAGTQADEPRWDTSRVAHPGVVYPS